MSENSKPFVVTDRRKFTLDGELRPDADPSPEKEHSAPIPFESVPTPELPASEQEAAEPEMPPMPSAEQMDQARLAYQMTAERLDTAIRAANPGMDHPPAMTFDQLIQSIYMSSIMQLGGATVEGQQPQVDILGARQSIDMLGVLAERTQGNLTPEEDRLLNSALFELRMTFLELTQSLARSAAAKTNAAGRPGAGPSIVR
jgi:hypothetical protein